MKWQYKLKPVTIPWNIYEWKDKKINVQHIFSVSVKLGSIESVKLLIKMLSPYQILNEIFLFSA